MNYIQQWTQYLVSIQIDQAVTRTYNLIAKNLVLNMQFRQLTKN